MVNASQNGEQPPRSGFVAEPTVSAISAVLKLLGEEKSLVVRFYSTALGRALSSFAVIFLIHEFLAIWNAPGAISRFVESNFGESYVLWGVALLLLVAYLVGAFMSYKNQVAGQYMIKAIELGIMGRLFRHLLTLSMPFFDRQSQGDIMHAVRVDVVHLRIFIMSLANIVMEGLISVALVVAVVWLSPWLALWGLVVLPIVSMPVFMLAKRIRARSQQVRRTSYELFDIIAQLVTGMRIIKIFRCEEGEARRSIDKGNAYFDGQIEITRIQSQSHVILESLAGLSLVVVVIIGGLQVMAHTLTWSALVASIMAICALHGPLNNMYMCFFQVHSHSAAIQKVASLLAERPEVKDWPNAAPLFRTPQEITFDRVDFAYGTTPVLHGVSFSVSAGETIGVVGPSGAGKSSLLNLLARFYDPTSGHVLLDGQDMRRYRLGSVYQAVALVSQEPFLFATSVRENIRCGRPDAVDADVEQAAQAAYIHEEILALPQGYETQVGIGGRTLSRGQRQRLNVARALLKNAPILLLDEATASLDSVAEAEVQRAIDRLIEQRTTFIVTHRLSTLRNVNRILVLERGRCVGFGTHAELQRDCPLYTRMLEAHQFDGGKGFGSPQTRLETIGS